MRTYTREEVEKIVRDTIECCATTAHYPTDKQPIDTYMRARWYTRKDILASTETLVKLIMRLS